MIHGAQTRLASGSESRLRVSDSGRSMKLKTGIARPKAARVLSALPSVTRGSGRSRLKWYASNRTRSLEHTSFRRSSAPPHCRRTVAVIPRFRSMSCSSPDARVVAATRHPRFFNRSIMGLKKRACLGVPRSKTIFMAPYRGRAAELTRLLTFSSRLAGSIYRNGGDHLRRGTLHGRNRRTTDRAPGIGCLREAH
jgi:hypothetical protein